MLELSTHATVDLKRGVPRDADAVAVFVHKQSKANDAGVARLEGPERTTLNDLLDNKLVTGKSNELSIHLLDGETGRRLIVVGLGNREKFSCECLREGAGVLAKAARRNKLKKVAVMLPDVPATLPGLPGAAPAGDGATAGAEAITSGLLLGSFNFDLYKGSVSKKNGNAKPANVSFTIVASDDDELATVRPAVDRGRAVAEGQNYARTIASRPGNDINPPALAKVAQELGRAVGVQVRVLDEKQMQKLGMGGILAVGAGANRTPPRMIVLEHRISGSGSRGSGRAKTRNPKPETRNPILVVGKAITFDTGGISIKPADKMGRMVFDKCGAMAVLGLIYAVAKLKLPIPVVGILASAENHISETAYRPGDILRMYNGVTVEVTNTDAEGRLVLGDALAWGIETYRPRAVVDLATLTGGCVVALGHIWAGLMSNSDELVDDLRTAAERAGEKVWRLPIGDDVRQLLKSDFADIVNSAGRWASPLTGGAFLSYFIPGESDGDGDGEAAKKTVPWAHLDIAGVAETEKELPEYAKGATGWGVRTLVEWLTGHLEPRVPQAMPRVAGG